MNRGLGLTDGDRVENIRGTAEVAKLLPDTGLVALVALISPLSRDRRRAREIVGEWRSDEAFIDVPVSECEIRDPKGLYRNALSKVPSNFTGVSAHYEVPALPEGHILNTASLDVLVSEIWDLAYSKSTLSLPYSRRAFIIGLLLPGGFDYKAAWAGRSEPVGLNLRDPTGLTSIGLPNSIRLTKPRGFPPKLH